MDKQCEKKKIAILGDTIVNGEIYGIQRFAYEILKQIDDINPASLNIILVVPRYADIHIAFDNIKIVKYGNVRNSFGWRQLCFPRYVKKNGCISVDMTLGLPFIGCDVVCLHDCIYENYPDDFVTVKEKLKRWSYLLRARRLVRKAKKIVTVSNNSKKELMDYYAVSDDKIDVVYNSWQHYERIVPNYDVLTDLKLTARKYYFSLGSGLKHKNLLWVVNCAVNNPDLKFVVTGSDKFSNYLSSLGLETVPNIIYTGYLPDDEVKALMKCCTAFIHPALMEGFGIPPLEALACGANIIVSNSSCLPEIYEGAALYIDPLNYKCDIQVLNDFPCKEVKARVLSKYSWRKSALKMIDIFKVL